MHLCPALWQGRGQCVYQALAVQLSWLTLAQPWQCPAQHGLPGSEEGKESPSLARGNAPQDGQCRRLPGSEHSGGKEGACA